MLSMKRLVSFLSLALLLFGGTALRVFFGNDVGYEGDTQHYILWANEGTSAPSSQMYTRDANYPPVSMFLLRLVAQVSQLFPSDPFRSDLRFLLVRSPAFLGDILTTLVVYILVAKTSRTAVALTVAALYFLNPAVISDSAFWGQTDGLTALFPLLALVMLHSGRSFLTGFFLLLGLGVKFQALPLIVAILVFAVVRLGLRGFGFVLLGAIAAIGASYFPFFLEGNFFEVIRAAYVSNLDAQPIVSLGALNFWKFSAPFSIMDGAVAFHLGSLPITFKTIGLFLFTITSTYVIAIGSIAPSLSQQLFAVGMVAFTFFSLPTQIHERYLLPALPFFASLIPSSWASALLYGFLSVLHFLSCYPTNRSGQALVTFMALPCFIGVLFYYTFSWTSSDTTSLPSAQDRLTSALRRIFQMLRRMAIPILASLVAILALSAFTVSGWSWRSLRTVELSSVGASRLTKSSWSNCPVDSSKDGACSSALKLTAPSTAIFFLPPFFTRLRSAVHVPAVSPSSSSSSCELSLSVQLDQRALWTKTLKPVSPDTFAIDLPLSLWNSGQELRISTTATGCAAPPSLYLLDPYVATWKQLQAEQDVREIYVSEVYPDTASILDSRFLGRDRVFEGPYGVNIGEKAYPRGVSMLPLSRMSFPIPKGFQTFEAEIGFSNNPPCEGMEQQFAVLLDGVEAYRSPFLQPSNTPTTLKIALAGKETITLVVDYPMGKRCGRATWGNARFLR